MQLYWREQSVTDIHEGKVSEMEPTLRRELDFKLVFDALADKNGMVQLEALSSHWPSNEARPSSLPSDCLSLWSQLADAKGCLDWPAFSKGITKALEGFLSNGTTAPLAGGRLQNLWEEKRARSCVSAKDIEGFLKSCSKDALMSALLSSRREVYSCQASLQISSMNMARDEAIFAAERKDKEEFIADTSLSQVYPPSGISTGHRFLMQPSEQFGERPSQQSTSLAESLTVLSTIRDVDGTDVSSRFPEGTTGSTHAQLPPTQEASECSQHQHLSRSRTLTLPRSSTHSRSPTRVMHDPPHNETESHLTPAHVTLSRSMMAMHRRPSPSSHSPTRVQNSLSVQETDSNSPHSPMATLPRRTCSSGSPSIKETLTATDQSSHSGAQQQQQQNSKSLSAGKTHKRSHSLVSYPSTTTTPMHTSHQPRTKVMATRVPSTFTTAVTIPDYGPISDL